ncbi:uncharacterized protein LOC131332577 [Rhododendron vialii]|uniref:uncharacterized protein LOC131332577 n=1 Tax=Rhododendron vialii TaxID=182163 RepID=UPI00265D7F70|nr:uncharacterized protein LOC131332577 [Rhododendron vialii]
MNDGGFVRVNQLINPSSATWKEDIIFRLFVPDHARCILSIPLSWTNRVDKLVWHQLHAGTYNVSSGYLSALELKNQRKALQRMRVIDDPSCPVCGSNQESVVHILCNCPLAVQAWRLSPLHDQSNKEWRMSVAAVLMWYIWKCRNRALFDHKLALPGVVCKWAMEYLQEFLSAKSLNPLNIVSSGKGAANSWIKPPDGIFKINVDGSWKKDMGKGGYGIVVRDYRGLFVVASVGFSKWCASSLVVEALAIRQSVHLGFQLGLGSIFVESDAQLLVKMLNGQVTTNQEVEIIIHDIQALSKNFQCYGFSFVRRTGNSVAYVLASKGLSGSGYSLWTESPPLWLLGPLSRDGSFV